MLEFKNVTLKDLKRAKLLDRYDVKYWFHKDLLPQVLAKIKDDYYMLNVDGENIIPYATCYFDTPGSAMYINHHNGKKTRYKIRKRTYMNSKLQFLELKFKNNKGKTFKSRIQTDNCELQLNDTERAFIDTNSPYDSDKLHVSLYNRFSRITLVNKDFHERCTIDFNLAFSDNDNQTNLDDMVIIEIKSDKGSAPSRLKAVLRDLRIKPDGFSKYCIGSALISEDLKQNMFKSKIRSISKILHHYSSDSKTA